MNLVIWGKNFETGIADVDEQHRFLVELTNKFGLLISQQDPDQEKLETVFTELLDYTRYHFHDEEQFMKGAGVDNRHCEYHNSEHKSFIDEVVRLHQDKVLREDRDKDLFEFLMHWLIYHILGSDLSMSRQAAMIASGISPAAAFAANEKEPDNAKELLLRSLNHLFKQVSQRNRELQELNQNLEDKVTARTRALGEANRQLEKLAMTDVLTGLANRRQALDMLKHCWQEGSNSNGALSCIMIDVDRFKEINDTYGHDIGDAVLADLARQLQHLVRTDDLLSRLGGDEFLIVCPRTDIRGAMHLAEQIHHKMSSQKVPIPAEQWNYSLSLGVAERTADMVQPEELIKHADRGVYLAKENGKNCVRSTSATSQKS